MVLGERPGAQQPKVEQRRVDNTPGGIHAGIGRVGQPL